MRICVLQSAYDGANHQLNDVDPGSDPSRFITTQHEFHHHWIKKETASKQIDDAISKGYDFYFNFMWGQHEDNVAGLEAIKYFESKRLPFVGLPSRVLLRSKIDFYNDAERLGAPPVPGRTKFPLFIKPAISCASMFISEKSICHNPSELESSIRNLKQALAPRRMEKARTLGLSLLEVEQEQDIVVQEFIDGQDYSVIVLEMADTPVALTPTVYNYPAGTPADERFMTFELKTKSSLFVTTIEREQDPSLFDRLQTTARDAFHTNQMHGCSWCNVDIRVKPSGEPFVMEVNPMPTVFQTPDDPWEDVVIQNSLPGGHLALVNILIATYFLQQDRADIAARRIAKVYDDWTPEAYDADSANNTDIGQLTRKIVSIYDFSGSVLDLGCGTGVFGQCLHPVQVAGNQPLSLLSGIELAGSMAKRSKERGYSLIYSESIPRVLSTILEVDHVVSISALLLLSPVDFSLTLCRSFQIAQRSITIHLDEIPDEYNAKLRELGPPYCYMVSYDHVPGMAQWKGLPNGWKLTDRWQAFSWKSKATDHNVYATVFRFEKG